MEDGDGRCRRLSGRIGRVMGPGCPYDLSVGECRRPEQVLFLLRFVVSQIRCIREVHTRRALGARRLSSTGAVQEMVVHLRCMSLTYGCLAQGPCPGRGDEAWEGSCVFSIGTWQKASGTFGPELGKGRGCEDIQWARWQGMGITRDRDTHHIIITVR